MLIVKSVEPAHPCNRKPIHKELTYNDCHGVHPPPSISHFSFTSLSPISHLSLTSLSLLSRLSLTYLSLLSLSLSLSLSLCVCV